MDKKLLHRMSVRFFKCLMVVVSSLLLLALAGQPVQAASRNGTAAGAANNVVRDPAYPVWVYQAVVGTPYTPQQFLSLPLAQQQALLAQLHPEIDPGVAAATASIGSQLTSGAPTVTASSVLAQSAQTMAVTGATAAAANTYLESVPTSAGVVTAQMTGSGVAGIATTGINRGTMTDAELGQFQASSFNVTTAAPLTASDVTVAYNNAAPYTLTLTLTASALTKLTYQGVPVTLTAHNAAGTKALHIVFNVWRPDIGRSHGSINLGNGLAFQYMYGEYYNGDNTHSTDVPILPQWVDIPNVNLLDTSGTTPIRYSGTYNDLSNDSNAPNWFGYYHVTALPDKSKWSGDRQPTTSSLIIGMKDAAAVSIGQTGNDFRPTFQFDDIKHVHMYTDPDNDNILHLDYDGYITSAAKLNYLGLGSLDQVVLNVQSTLSPSSDGGQMAMDETVTNPQTINGVPNTTQDLKGIYFLRTYDTAFNHYPANAPSQKNQADNTPIYYSPVAPSGPLKGKVPGFYIQTTGSSTEKNPNIDIQYNFNSPYGPDGWLGTNMLPVDQNISAIYVNGNPGTTKIGEDISASGWDYRFDNPTLVFNSPADPGMAANPFTVPTNTDGAYGAKQPGKVAFKRTKSSGDTGIAMKWSPVDLAPGEAKRMQFNATINSAQPPKITVASKTLTIPQGASAAAVAGLLQGGVFDSNSQKVNIYASTTAPDMTESAAALAADTVHNVKLTATPLDYSTTSNDQNPPHATWLAFPQSVLANILDQINDGGTHQLYLFAIDVPGTATDPQYSQADPLVSNLATVTVNPEASATIKFVDPDGNQVPGTKTYTKTGRAGTAYNFADTSAGDLTTSAATVLTGHAPATVGTAPTYRLAPASQQPTTIKGTLPTDGVTINIVYLPQYLELVPPALNFGQNPVPTVQTSYNNSGQDGNKFTVTDYRSGAERAESLNLTAQMTAFQTAGQSPLTALQLVYQYSQSTSPVTLTPSTDAYGPAQTIAAGFSGTGNQYTIDFAKIQLTSSARSAANPIEAGAQYTATVQYTITDGL